MNIFHKVALQSLRKSRTRTIVTIAGVVLSAAMITAVATFAVSLQRYTINGAVKKYGDWHIAFLDVDLPFVQERALDNKVKNAAAFENIGYAPLNGGKNPSKPYLFIAGFSEKAFATLPIHLVSGRLPQNSDEILVPSHVAANGGVRFALGDTLSLAVGSRTGESGNLGQHDPYVSADEPDRGAELFSPRSQRIYTVVGICERPGFEEFAAPGYTLITVAEPATKSEGYSVFVTLQNPRDVQTYAANTAGTHSYVLNDDVLRFMGLSDDKLFNTLLYSIGGILVALIMVGSVFLIYNAFNISLGERTQQFGILSSVGATERQLRNCVLFEGFCIGAVGIPVGVVLGIASIRLVLFVVAKNFRNILYDTVPLTLTVSVPALVAAVAVSMLTILISAYIPARNAAGTPVMESIRQTNAVKVEAKQVKTSKRAERIFGLEGTLALKNLRRNRKRYHSIVLSLTFSVVLFVSASTFGAHLKQAAERSVTDTDYDICFTTQDMGESELFRLRGKLQTAEGVTASSYQGMMTYSCAVKASDLSEAYRESSGGKPADDIVNLAMDIQLIEDSVYLDFIKDLGLPAEDYTGPNPQITVVAKGKSDEDAGQSALYNLFVSPSMTLAITPETDVAQARSQERSINVAFVDTIPVDTIPRLSSETKPYVFMAVVPFQLKGMFETPGAHTDVGLTFLSETPSQSVIQMERMIQGEGLTSSYNLYDVNKMFEESRNVVFIVDVFSYVFVIMISLIATANVFNTISTSIRLRRRELAMLCSVGMADREFNRMLHCECFFFGARTLLIGLPAAGVIAWLIYRGLVAGGADIVFAFPWGSVAVSVFGVFFVVIVAMLYAVRKIRRENIIDALRDDMT